MDDLVVFHSICTKNPRMMSTMTTTYRAQSEKHTVDIYLPRFTTYLPPIFPGFSLFYTIMGLRLVQSVELQHRGHDDPRLHHRRLPEDCGLPGPMLQDRAEGVGKSPMGFLWEEGINRIFGEAEKFVEFRT